MSDPQEQFKLWLAKRLEPRGVAANLARALNSTPTKVSRMKNLNSGQEVRSISLAEAEGIAKFFKELPPGFESMTHWLTPEAASNVVEMPTPAQKMPTPNASFPPRYQSFPSDTSIPLRGHIAAGPNGRFIMNGQDIARVFCPPGLEGVEGAYAVQVQGTSGEPRFFSGETAWVNPHARYRQNDDVIVQVMGENGDDEVYSYIKRFVSESKELLRLYQYNPGAGEEHELEFPRDRVFSIHKVVFHAML